MPVEPGPRRSIGGRDVSVASGLRGSGLLGASELRRVVRQGGGLLLVLALLLLVVPSFTSPAHAATVRLYLHNRPSPPSGNAAAVAVVDMTPSAPTASTLYNYAVDLVSDRQGRFLDNLHNSASYASMSNPRYVVNWTYQVPETLDVSAASAGLWLAKTTRCQKAGSFALYLFQSTPAGRVRLASSFGTVPSTDGVGPQGTGPCAFGFVPASLPVSATVPAGATLDLRLFVFSDDDDPAQVAYDTTSFPAYLDLTATQPTPTPATPTPEPATPTPEPSTPTPEPSTPTPEPETPTPTPEPSTPTSEPETPTQTPSTPTPEPATPTPEPPSATPTAPPPTDPPTPTPVEPPPTPVETVPPTDPPTPPPPPSPTPEPPTPTPTAPPTATPPPPTQTPDPIPTYQPPVRPEPPPPLGELETPPPPPPPSFSPPTATPPPPLVTPPPGLGPLAPMTTPAPRPDTGDERTTQTDERPAGRDEEADEPPRQLIDLTNDGSGAPPGGDDRNGGSIAASIADLARTAGEAVKTFAFPLSLTILVLVFLLVQGEIDRRDPKLAFAPVDSSKDMVFFE